MRTCRRCLKPKPDSEFGVNRYYETRGARDGRSIYCRKCNRKHTVGQRAQSRHLLKNTKVKVSYASLGYHP